MHKFQFCIDFTQYGEGEMEFAKLCWEKSYLKYKENGFKMFFLCQWKTITRIGNESEALQAVTEVPISFQYSSSCIDELYP